MEENPEPLITYPDPDTPPPVTGAVSLASPNLVNSISPNGLHVASSEVKFEQKRMTSNVQTKVSSQKSTKIA